VVVIQLGLEGHVSGLGKHALFLQDGHNAHGLKTGWGSRDRITEHTPRVPYPDRERLYSPGLLVGQREPVLSRTLR
jgi:hypothetical protein